MELGSGVTRKKTGQTGIGRRPRSFRRVLLFFALASVAVACALPGAALAIASGGSAGSYPWVAPSAPLDQSGIIVTATATAESKTYDGTTTATVTLSLTGVESGDDVAATYSSATFADKNAGTDITVTVSGISLIGEDAGNYTLASDSTTTTADITPKELTVTGGTAANKDYDGTTDAVLDFGSAVLFGVIGTDDVSLFAMWGSGAFVDKYPGMAKQVLVQGLTLLGGDADNYTLTQPTLIANIYAKELTIIGATAVDKVYDGSIDAEVDFGGAELEGVIGGTVDSPLDGWGGREDVDLDYESYTATFAGKNIGVDIEVTVSGLSLTGEDKDNYTLASPTLSADITLRELTVEAYGVDKTYDGTTDTTVTLECDKVIDDAVDPAYDSAAFSDDNAGSNKTVNVTGICISGADADNYTLANETTTTTANITPKDLSATAVADDKTYDGTTDAAVVLSSGDVIGGDTVTFSPSTGSFADKTVGDDKTVTVSGITLGGADAGNYTLTNDTATATANITPKDLSATAVADDKIYDGTTDAAMVLSSGDVIGGDTVTFSPSTGSFADKTVGDDKTVTVSGIAIGGTDAGNYTLTNDTATATANITPKDLTVSGAVASGKVYDATTSATVDFSSGPAKLDGVIGGDTVTLDASGYVAAFADKAVGTGKPVTVTGVALGGADAGNYSVEQPSGLTASITAKGLTVSATGVNKVYDGDTAATVTLSTDKVSGDDVTPAYTGAAFADEDVADGIAVDVDGISISGADAGNYTLSNTTAATSADITPKVLTVAGAVANDKVYDATATATVDFATGPAGPDGIVGSDIVALDASGYTATFADKAVGNDKPVAVTGLVLTGADAGNYSLTQPTLKADIAAKALTVTGAVASGKVYDGTTAATVDFGSTVLVGVVGSEDVTLDSSSYSAFFDSGSIGTGKPVTVTGVALGGADAGNYSVEQPSGLTASITAKGLTVSATGVNKVYDGDTAATVTLSTDKVSGDDVTPAYTGAAFADEDVANGLAVDVDGISISGADAGNYTLSNTTAATSADITPKALTVTGAVAANKLYDGTSAATVDFGAATLVGVVAGDVVALDASGYTATFADKAVGADKPVAVTGLVIGGADVGNYTLTQPTLKADITGTQPTVSMDGITAADTSWHKDPVTLTFTPHVGSYGVASVEYMVNGGAWTAITAAGGAYQVTFSTSGTYAVSYRVTDNAGLVSAVGTCTVKIDNAQPVAKAKKASTKKGKKVGLKIYIAKDPAGCGTAKVTIKFCKGSTVKKSVTTKPMTVNKWNTYMWKCTLAKGSYTMKLYVTDSIGNTQSKVGSAKLKVK